MANRNFPASRTFGFNLLPVRLESSFNVGASGAVSSAKVNNGVKSITRLAAGIYQLQLDDNYAAFLSAQINFKAPVTGSNVAATALTPGVVYEITALGTTTQAQWVTAGVPSGITASVGLSFLAAATSSGNGTAKAIGASGVNTIEMVGNPQQGLSNQPFVQGSGGSYLIFKCIGPTSSSDTTPIAVDPASGSICYIELIMNNSQVM